MTRRQESMKIAPQKESLNRNDMEAMAKASQRKTNRIKKHILRMFDFPFLNLFPMAKNALSRFLVRYW